MAKHIIVPLEDAKLIALALQYPHVAQGHDVLRIIRRFLAEEGADLEDMVVRLKKMRTCAACAIEAQESYCTSIEARAQGRRLARLLDRAANPQT